MKVVLNTITLTLYIYLYYYYSSCYIFSIKKFIRSHWYLLSQERFINSINLYFIQLYVLRMYCIIIDDNPRSIKSSSMNLYHVFLFYEPVSCFSLLWTCIMFFSSMNLYHVFLVYEPVSCFSLLWTCIMVFMQCLSS